MGAIKSTPVTVSTVATTTIIGVIMVGLICCVRNSAALSTPTTSSSKSYDLVVIGGGSAGLTAAKFAATFGKSCCIVEEDKLGGDCTWTGCVPSKTLLSSAKAAVSVRKAAMEFGVKNDELTTNIVDMKDIKNRIISTRQKIYEADDSPQVMKKLGIDTISGTASFLSSDMLKVTSSEKKNDGDDDSSVTVVAKEGIVIATGAKAVRPTSDDLLIKGLDTVNYLTYEEVFELDVLPKKLTIVGGGPIGCELAQAFARLGSIVTLIAPILLPREEPEVSQAIEDVFQKEGIIRVKSRVQSVASSSSAGSNDGSIGGGHVAVCCAEQGISSATTVEGDVMLVAVGRQPRVDIEGLKDVGIKLNDRNGIDVDNNLKTAVRGIYAAGDCTGDKQFTHYAGYQGAVAARNVLLPFTDPGVLSDSIPATTFTSPEVASVGLSEKEARAKFSKTGAISVAMKEIKDVDRAECENEDIGFIKIIYKTKSYEILGATIVSTAAGEMISEIAVAMKAKLKFDTLATVMHSYPSYSFALQAMAAEIYYDKLLRYKGIFDFLKKFGF